MRRFRQGSVLRATMIVLGMLLCLAACTAPAAAPTGVPAPLAPTPTPEDAAPPPTPEAAPVPSPTAVPPGDLATDVRDLVADYGDHGLALAGIIIRDGEGRDIVRLNPDHRFVAGSLYKLFLLWKTQVEIRAGRLADDTPLVLEEDTDDSAEDGYALGDYGTTITVAEARRLMITASNNTAAWMLAKRIGWAEIQRTLRERGFFDTETSPDLFTTPAEVTRFFVGVRNGTLDPLLTPDDYRLMLDLLEAQEVNTMLPQGWPSGLVFAHKTGEVEGVAHDAGVLLLPGGRAVYVTVMTEGDYTPALEFMRDLAGLIWRDVVRPTLLADASVATFGATPHLTAGR